MDTKDSGSTGPFPAKCVLVLVTCVEGRICKTATLEMYPHKYVARSAPSKKRWHRAALADGLSTMLYFRHCSNSSRPSSPKVPAEPPPAQPAFLAASAAWARTSARPVSGHFGKRCL